jgi:membrane protein DedA with SNARE-associated domain/rhodanese-related sulfurtransferase
MPLALQFFVHYAYLVLFLWVLGEQLGAPVPSIPLLVTAGSLTATHQLFLPLVLGSVLVACFVADSLWYFMGKRYGGAMVRLVCKFSFEISTCVRKTENYFTKHGPDALLVAKFIPGLGTVAAPIAGQTGMKYPVFLAYDLAGALMWASAAVLSGRFFGDVIKRDPGVLAWFGHSAGILILLAIVGFLFYRVWKQRSFLKQLETARLEPTELKQMLDAGENPFIVDLRHPLDYLPDPRVLPGAVRISPDQLLGRSTEIPRDRDIILYCTCPSEATSAKVAMNLRRAGIYRVRPLRGGFDAWKKLGLPLRDYEEQPLVQLESTHS